MRRRLFICFAPMSLVHFDLWQTGHIPMSKDLFIINQNKKLLTHFVHKNHYQWRFHYPRKFNIIPFLLSPSFHRSLKDLPPLAMRFFIGVSSTGIRWPADHLNCIQDPFQWMWPTISMNTLSLRWTHSSLADPFFQIKMSSHFHSLTPPSPVHVSGRIPLLPRRSL